MWLDFEKMLPAPIPDVSSNALVAMAEVALKHSMRRKKNDHDVVELFAEQHRSKRFRCIKPTMVNNPSTMLACSIPPSQRFRASCQPPNRSVRACFNTPRLIPPQPRPLPFSSSYARLAIARCSACWQE